MSLSSSRFSVPFLIYVIILAGLIYAFHIELFVTGVRLYATAVSSPRAERLLGDYYRKNAYLSNELSLNFYAKAMQKYKTSLTSANPIEQANIKLQIGRLYLCGKGVLQSQTEAKRWLDEAQQTLDAALQNGEKNHEPLVQMIKQATTSSSQSNQNSNLLPECQLQTEPEFIVNILNSRE